MPNQLSQSKRRASLAEHAAVLEALAVIASKEKTTVMELLREGARQVVRTRAQNAMRAEELRRKVLKCAPSMPVRFKSAAQVARFKRRQREFDVIVQELGLVAPETVQRKNSLVPEEARISVSLFDDAAPL